MQIVTYVCFHIYTVLIAGLNYNNAAIFYLVYRINRYSLNTVNTCGISVP